MNPETALTSDTAAEIPPLSAPRASVILTVYNRKEFLSAALESALGQTFRDFEIIVVDDSGAAAFREIATTYNSGNRVRYLANDATLGVARHVVKAVDHARGDLIAIINDDDIWEERLLEELAAPLAADPACVAVFSDHSVIDHSGKIDHSLSESWSAGAGRASLPGGIVPDASRFVIEGSGFPIALCTLFRKSAVNWTLVGPEVSGAYDYWISCLLAASGGSIYYVPRRLARYRVHSAMETYSRHDKWENLIYMFSTIRARAWFPYLDTSIKGNLAEALFGVARDKLHFNRYAEARSLFWKSFLVSHRVLPLAGIVATFFPSGVRSGLASLLSSCSLRSNRDMDTAPLPKAEG